MQESFKSELRGIAIFIGALWAVWFLDLVLPTDLVQWGLRPRTISGLIGIPLMPFLHGGLGHLLSNTVPLAILLTLLAGSRANSWQVVIELIVLGGGLLWLLGRSSSVHVGASGLVYGLVAFFIVAGWLERRFVSLGIAILVAFLYGGSLFWSILPGLDRHTSWDGHLFGAIAGAAVAYFNLRKTDSIPVSPTDVAS